MRLSRRNILGLAGTSALALFGSGSGSAAAASGHHPRQPVIDPTPLGSFVPAPFLALPFAKATAWDSLYATNGWHNSPDENGWTGVDAHHAIDFELVNTPDHGWGVPVLAAAAGRAYFTYQYISESRPNPETGVVQQVGVGAGLVVEIRHAKDTPDQAGFVTQYIHLSSIVPDMPYLKPTDAGGGDWTPSGLFQPNDTLWDLGMPVNCGDVIGYQGDTGMGLDWRDDFDLATGQVHPRDRQALKPWDPVQLHFQLYQGRVNGAKQNIIDPSGQYSMIDPGEWCGPGTANYNVYTPTPGDVQVGPRSVFLTDTNGEPVFAG